MTKRDILGMEIEFTESYHTWLLGSGSVYLCVLISQNLFPIKCFSFFFSLLPRLIISCLDLQISHWPLINSSPRLCQMLLPNPFCLPAAQTFFCILLWFLLTSQPPHNLLAALPHLSYSPPPISYPYSVFWSYISSGIFNHQIKAI